MSVTIFDIAQRTGFSAPTISKALNNQTDVSEATRAKIIETARQMGYIPNQGAKSLRTRKTWLIGVIYEELDQNLGIEHPLFNGIMNAFKQRIEQDGYELMFIATNLGRKKMSYLEHCRYRHVDGVLVLNSDVLNPEVLEVVRSSIPCVSANITYEEIPTVSSENVQSSMEGVKYLVSLGHTRIGYIGGPYDTRTLAGYERRSGYRQGLAACGLPLREDYEYRGDHWSPQCGYEATLRLMALQEPPTALFAAGDAFTLGVYPALRDLGLSVPGDVSVLGFDDNEVSRHLHPPLTTFRQDRREIGRVAAEQMLARIAGETPPATIRIPVELVIRSSCQSRVP